MGDSFVPTGSSDPMEDFDQVGMAGCATTNGGFAVSRIRCGVALGSQAGEPSGFVFHPGLLLLTVCPNQAGKAAVGIGVDNGSVAQEGAVDKPQNFGREAFRLTDDLIRSLLPKTMRFFVGMPFPIGLDTLDTSPLLEKERWDVEPFTAAALTEGTQWFGLFSHTLSAIGLLAVGVALKLVSRNKAARSAVGANGGDAGAASTGAGDKIRCPA